MKNTSIEICIALEDFVYGNEVKISIPSMQPFTDKQKITETKNKINVSNIMNKTLKGFNVRDKYCKSTNYISVLIPQELYRHKDSSYKGLKGETFAITFLGGNIDKPLILRRI